MLEAVDHLLCDPKRRSTVTTGILSARNIIDRSTDATSMTSAIVFTEDEMIRKKL